MPLPVSGGTHLRLLALLDKLDIPLDISNLPTRIEQQKKVYLAQVMGIVLGYQFRWHIYGPYSENLHHDLFQLNALRHGYERNGIAFKSKASLGGGDLVKIRSVFQKISALPTRSVPHYWWELVSSIHFLMTTARPKAETPANVLEVLEREKPGKFNKQDADQAIAFLTDKEILK